MTPCPICGEVYVCKVPYPRPAPARIVDCPKCDGTGNESKRGGMWWRTCDKCHGGGTVWVRS